MEEQNKNPAGWLIFGLIIWAVPIFLRIAGVNATPAVTFAVSLVWMTIPFIYGYLSKDWKGVGFTKDRVGEAIKVTLIVTAIYSIVRNLLIVFMPGTIPYIAASALPVAESFKQGQFGNTTIPGSMIFPAMFLITFVGAVAVEIFYRGFLFTRLRQFIDWRSAVVVSAVLFGLFHYFNVGLTGFIMGVVVSLIAGWLMQKYNNVLAPVLFHFLQYLITILVFYYFVL